MQTKFRRNNGSIAAEHMAALIVLFLGLFFPLCNLATCFYRYTLVVQAVHNAAHLGGTASSFTAGSSQHAVMDVIPRHINNFLASTRGVRNPIIKVRLIETRLSDSNVKKLPDGQKLTPPRPLPAHIYSVETTLECDVEPLISFKNNLVPSAPGMNAPFRASITTRELLERPQGMVN